MAKSAVGVTIVMILGYILSFAKEAIIANYFGVSEQVDAYSIAIQVPVLLFAFISAAIRSVVIPIYSDLLYKNGQKEADDYVSKLITLIGLIAVIVIIIGEVFAGGLIYLFAPGFSEQTHLIAVELLRITFPAVFFSVIINVLIAVLNVHKQFMLPSFAVYFLNIGLILTIVLLHAKLGVAAACLGQIIGEILSFVFVAMITQKIYKYHFKYSRRDASIKTTLRMALPVMWTVSIAEINAVINRVVGSFLIAGSISALSYAGKIDNIMMTLFVSALTTIVYPMYAEAAAKDNMQQINVRINWTLSVLSLVLIPLTFGVFIYKKEIVELVYGRGHFDVEAIEITQRILGYYAIGLPFMACRTTITQIFHSLKDTKTPAINTTIGGVLNIVLNIAFVCLMGVNGLALSRSLVAIYITISLLFVLTKKHPEIKTTTLSQNLKGIIPAALIMFLCIGVFNWIDFFQSSIISLLLGVILGCITYILCLYLWRVPIAISLINRVKNKNTIKL